MALVGVEVPGSAVVEQAQGEVIHTGRTEISQGRLKATPQWFIKLVCLLIFDIFFNFFFKSVNLIPISQRYFVDL